MGYYNYQNGLIINHVNQNGGWENHQENCRNLIVKALKLYKPEKITVLGSGWLLELPIAEMIEQSKKVCLIDIIHPPDVISQSRSYKNVELIEQDVTGGLIEEIWQKTRKYSLFNKMRSFTDIIVPEYKPGNDPGMVISLNILTQLESLLIRYIKKKSVIKEEDIDLFRTEIQKKHLEFLRKHISVLITDFAEVITDREGTVKNIPTLLTDLPPCKLKEEWIWDFDNKGADFYNSRSKFKVVGLII